MAKPMLGNPMCCTFASRSDYLFDVDRRPCSDSCHVTAPYKSALYYFIIMLRLGCQQVKIYTIKAEVGEMHSNEAETLCNSRKKLRR